MALSNWSTLAAVFAVESYTLSPNDPGLSDEARAATKRMDELGKAMAAATQAGEGTEAHTNAFFEASDASMEARTVRSCELAPCEGAWRHDTERGRVSAELYKNWVYLNIGGQTVELHAGALSSGGVSMRATRGPQEGVYFVMWTTRREERDGRRYEIVEGMAGCGVYAYTAPDGTQLDDEDAGVHPDSAAFADEWLAGLDGALSTVKLSSLQQFNQGDMFFAGELGFDVPTSAVGDGQVPLLARALGSDSAQPAN